MMFEPMWSGESPYIDAIWEMPGIGPFSKYLIYSHHTGMNTGDMISELAGKIHPKARIVIPLYRSCLVILPNKRGDCRIIAYHDPAWMGHDVTIDTLRNFKQVYIIQGQRSGPDIIRDIDTSSENKEYSCGELYTIEEAKGIIEGQKFGMRMKKWWYKIYLLFAHRNFIARKIYSWKFSRLYKKAMAESKGDA